ncbi:Lrp/AsnC family transcriptional regulator [Vibrio sp. M250220]|uniref:Lrp/AsnC family transcriptional regulator n=1 Tax=unclassified Vibrio TaxID=2614977 RepID=UPI002F406B4C
MDKFDQQILNILKLNARASVSDIARQVNLSRSAVTARIQKLESEKVILGYHAEVAKKESTELIKAYLALKFDMSSSTQYCETYADQIYQIDGVKWCHAISGETDMMLYVEVETMTQLNAIRDQLQKIPELRHLMTHTVLTEFFNTLHHAK